ncbi:MAG TPA: c-type cytochrome [Paralcaligenes sp.]|jgi:cytochrome c
MSLKLLRLILLVGGTVWLAPACAQSVGLGLAQSGTCMACHQVDRKRVGPAFTVIAQRFSGQPGANEYLANAIRSGGRGRWGAVPMPAQPQVSPEQAKAIAAWILSLADKSTHGQQ